MALKNYTSQVPASRSITFIEGKLVQHGARDIMKRYDDNGRVSAIMFQINVDGRPIAFRLPARIEQCQEVLLAELSSKARPETRKKIPDQAERTGWKIVSDWVEAQMAMIELAQVEIMEVFLPYVYDAASEKTYFETLQEQGYRALLTN